MDTIGARPQRIPWQRVLVFLFVTTLIILGGSIHLAMDFRRVRKEKRNELGSIAKLKVDQISSWLNERKGDGWALTLSPIFAEAVDRMLNEKTNSPLKRKIKERLAAFNNHMDYSNIILIDDQDRIIVAADNDENEISHITGQWVKKAKLEKRVIFSDFYFCDLCQTVHLDIFAPIFSGEEGHKIKAALILRIDPHHFLYPAVQSWPTPSQTAETYMIKRQDDYALFLNELRFKKNTALKFKLPLNYGDYLSASAAVGREGFIEGKDYQNGNCVAFIKKIPESDWVLVAKISKQEIFSEVYRHAWYTFIIMGVLVLATALFIGFLWYRQQKEFYQEQLLLEKEKQLMSQRYQFLTKYANDIIMLCDGEYNIIDANERAIEVYGYKPDELFKLNVRDIRAVDAQKSIESDFDKAAAKKGAIYEVVHKRKDGSVFPVEVSNRLIEIDEKKYFQGIIRDITERKRFENKLREANEDLESANRELTASDEELRDQMVQLQASRNELLVSEQKYRSLFESTGTAMVIIENDTTISLANAEFEKLSGYSRGEIEGKMKWTEFVCKPDLERMREYHYQRRQDTNIAPRRYEFHFSDRIGMIRDIFLAVDMIPGTGKSVASLVDITKRKIAELQVKASLREKEVLLREIYHRVKNNLQVVSSLLSLQSGYVQDPRDKEIFLESQNRIRSMSLVHENLYKSSNLARIDFGHYVRNLISDLIRSYGILSDQLAVTVDINDIEMGVDVAIPCGLMINEMVSNSLKHAFKKPPAAGKKWELTARLKLKRDVLYCLEVADNGTGFADKSTPLSAPATLGLQLITILAEQLDGKVTMHQKNGTRYVVEFRKVT